MEGWNDPPKNVGMPTGNLKINLNKRIAFPLSSSGVTQNASASPLLLPPKPSAEVSLTTDAVKPKEPLVSEVDLNTQRDKVMCVLTKRIELSSTVQPSVAAKLKTLEDDWAKLDPEILKLLAELSQYLELSDVKNASTTHRKIVMKGCNKPWLTAIRQILMSLETAHVEDPITVASVDPIPFDVLPTNE